MCTKEKSTHDASFSLYKDLLLLAGREAGPERWLLFTEPAPTLKEAQLDFLRFLLRGRKDGRGGRGSMKNDITCNTTMTLMKVALKDCNAVCSTYHTRGATNGCIVPTSTWCKPKALT